MKKTTTIYYILSFVVQRGIISLHRNTMLYLKQESAIFFGTLCQLIFFDEPLMVLVLDLSSKVWIFNVFRV